MKLGTAERNGTSQAFRSDGGVVTYLPYPDVGALLLDEGWRSVPGEVGDEPRAGDLLAPITAPRTVICVGLNYREHAAEVGKSAPEFPTLFSKLSGALIGPSDDIVMPAPELSAMIDWEAELVIVIGTRLKHADQRAAAAAIVGYTVMNDVSVRDWQKRTEEWLQGKNFDRTTPIGPVIVTADELDPARGLHVETIVNGAVEQSGRTDDLIFSPAEIVSYISRFHTLKPGDLIATGTPAGIGASKNPPRFLRSGDELVTRIEGIGELRNRCVSDDGLPRP